MPFFHQLQQLALAHDSVREIQTRELDLLGVTGDAQFVEEPVVQRAMILKFQRTNGMGDPFDRIR